MKKLYVIIFIVVLVTGCSSVVKLKFNKLASEYDKLERENKSLEETLRSLETDVDILKSQIDQKNNALTVLKEQVTNDTIFVWNDVPFGRSLENLYKWLNSIESSYGYFKDGFEFENLKDEDVEMLYNFRSIFNKEYSVYCDDKLVGRTKGRLLIVDEDGYEGVEPVVSFDTTNLEGIFLSGDYDHMPRKVNRILDTTSVDVKDYVLTNNVNIVEKFTELGKKIVPNNMDIVITQIIECDLDGDGRLEKIVNYSNAYKDRSYIEENWNEHVYSNYYTIIVVFDDNYQLVDYVHNIIDIETKIDYSILFTDISYILDVNNDSRMELISIQPVWEGVLIHVDSLRKYKRRIEGDIYRW